MARVGRLPAVQRNFVPVEVQCRSTGLAAVTGALGVAVLVVLIVLLMRSFKLNCDDLRDRAVRGIAKVELTLKLRS